MTTKRRFQTPLDQDDALAMQKFYDQIVEELNNRPTRYSLLAPQQFILDSTNPPSYGTFSTNAGGTSTGIAGYRFPASTDTYVHLHWTLPPDYKEGTDLTFVYQYHTLNSGGGAARFSFEYQVIPRAGSGIALGNTSNNTNVTIPTTIDTLLEYTDTIPASSLDHFGKVMARFGRIGSAGGDTHGGGLRIHNILLVYEADELRGSEEKFVKYK